MDDTQKDHIKVKSVPAQSNTLAGVATALGGAALGGVVIQGIGNTMSRYLGNIGANIGALSGTLPGTAPAVTFAQPVYTQPVMYQQPMCAPASCGGDYVTEKVAALMDENAQFKAEKNAVKAIKEETEPLKTRVCELEAYVKVAENNNIWMKRYVDSTFVHQPKMKFKHRYIETDDGCCEQSAE